MCVSNIVSMVTFRDQFLYVAERRVAVAQGHAVEWKLHLAVEYMIFMRPWRVSGSKLMTFYTQIDYSD